MRSSSRGSALVEFAASLPVLSAVLFIGIEMARASAHHVSLQFALTRAMRWAVLGQTLPAMTRAQSIKYKLQEIGTTYKLEINTADISVCPVAQPACGGSNPGLGGELIQISASEEFQMVFGGWSLTLSSSVVGSNEPFT